MTAEDLEGQGRGPCVDALHALNPAVRPGACKYGSPLTVPALVEARTRCGRVFDISYSLV